MNSNTEKRRQFVEDLMQIIEKSDYIKRLYAIDRENRINDGQQQYSIIRRLAIRYGKLREVVISVAQIKWNIENMDSVGYNNVKYIGSIYCPY